MFEICICKCIIFFSRCSQNDKNLKGTNQTGHPNSETIAMSREGISSHLGMILMEKMTTKSLCIKDKNKRNWRNCC